LLHTPICCVYLYRRQFSRTASFIEGGIFTDY
jgi:hypothetical protein